MRAVHIYPNKLTVISIVGEEVISNDGRTVVIRSSFASSGKGLATPTTSARSLSTLSKSSRPKE